MAAEIKTLEDVIARLRAILTQRRMERNLAELPDKGSSEIALEQMLRVLKAVELRS